MLTWNELKKLVDYKLQENETDGDIKISNIELGRSDTIENTVVCIEEGTLRIF